MRSRLCFGAFVSDFFFSRHSKIVVKYRRSKSTVEPAELVPLGVGVGEEMHQRPTDRPKTTTTTKAHFSGRFNHDRHTPTYLRANMARKRERSKNEENHKNKSPTRATDSKIVPYLYSFHPSSAPFPCKTHNDRDSFRKRLVVKAAEKIRGKQPKHTSTTIPHPLQYCTDSAHRTRSSHRKCGC